MRRNKLDNRIICGDCEEVLREFPDSCVDLVVTYPSYVECGNYVKY